MELIPVAEVVGPYKLTDRRIRVEFTRDGMSLCQEGDLLVRLKDVQALLNCKQQSSVGEH